MLYNHNSSMAGKDPVKSITEALAQALVPYYPFAGRLIEGPNSKLFVDCTSEGVLFVEANADATVAHVIDKIESGEDPYMEELLHDVPGSNSSILGFPLRLVQVTRFECGGFSLALRFNHTMIDGTGLGQFLHAMQEYALGARSLSLPPVWKREYFLARTPPRITCQHLEFEEVENISPQATAEFQNEMTNRIFHFGPEEILDLKKHLQNQEGKRYSTFDVVTSCLWRSRTRALELDPDQMVRLGCVVHGLYKKDLEVPLGYYGNMFANPTVISKSQAVCGHPLEYTAEFVKAKMSGEYLRSAMDLSASKGRPHYSLTWNFLVSDSRRTGIDKVDFGWGTPIYGGPVCPFPGGSAYSSFKEVRED